MTNNGGIDYSNYLELSKILDSQHLESLKQTGSASHEEMLFIVTHQTYELWFKQILWEIDSVLKIFKENFVDEENLSIAVHRLKRINEIWRILVDQIKVLETMTPLEFLDFRNHLYPASGFQSAQFRLIENKLGLKPEKRKTHGGCPYHSFLNEKELPQVRETEKEVSLLKALELWLERTPYLKTKGYDFWKDYETSVYKMYQEEQKLVQENASLNEEQKDLSCKSLENAKRNFEDFMNENTFAKNKEKNGWSLSFKSLQAALFIQLYRHNIKLQSANRILEELIDLDENMTLWRNRHAQMALRMLGDKVGTGGSSGALYLKEASDSHKIFGDFFKLTTYFIDPKKLKSLPEI